MERALLLLLQREELFGSHTRLLFNVNRAFREYIISNCGIDLSENDRIALRQWRLIWDSPESYSIVDVVSLDSRLIYTMWRGTSIEEEWPIIQKAIQLCVFADSPTILLEAIQDLPEKPTLRAFNSPRDWVCVNLKPLRWPHRIFATFERVDYIGLARLLTNLDRYTLRQLAKLIPDVRTFQLFYRHTSNAAWMPSGFMNMSAFPDWAPPPREDLSSIWEVALRRHGNFRNLAHTQLAVQHLAIDGPLSVLQSPMTPEWKVAMLLAMKETKYVARTFKYQFTVGIPSRTLVAYVNPKKPSHRRRVAEHLILQLQQGNLCEARFLHKYINEMFHVYRQHILKWVSQHMNQNALATLFKLLEP
jgi:hypothetical protein